MQPIEDPALEGHADVTPDLFMDCQNVLMYAYAIVGILKLDQYRVYLEMLELLFQMPDAHPPTLCTADAVW